MHGTTIEEREMKERRKEGKTKEEGRKEGRKEGYYFYSQSTLDSTSNYDEHHLENEDNTIYIYGHTKYVRVDGGIAYVSLHRRRSYYGER